MVRLNKRWQFLEWFTLKSTSLSSYLLKDRPWKYSLKDCSKMAENSLGYHLYKYLNDNNIDFNPNLIRHDMKHILLGYEMKIKDELRIHTFLIGNKNYNILGNIYFLICIMIVPKIVPSLKKDYLRGKQSLQLKNIDLQNYANHDLKKLQKKFRIQPLT